MSTANPSATIKQPRQPLPPRLSRPLPLPMGRVLAAAVVGILADVCCPLPVAAVWTLSAASLLGWCGCHRWQRAPRAQEYFLLMAIAALAGVWHHAHWQLYRHDELGRIATRGAVPVCLEGYLLYAPRWVPAPPADALRTMPGTERTRCVLEVTAIRNGTDWQSASGITNLTIGGPIHGLQAGDHIQVLGQLSQPPPATNPGQFDRARHLRADRKLCQVWSESAQCITLLQPAGRWNGRRLLGVCKQRALQTLQETISSPRYGLAAAVLVGTRELLDAESNDAYFKTGAVHLLSISGVHVSILAMILLWPLRNGLMNRHLAIGAAVGLAILFALVIQAEAPALRATALVIFYCLGLLLRRPRATHNLLAAAAIVVLILYPADLFRLGPQLSFLSVAALEVMNAYRRKETEPDPLDQLIARTRPWPVRWCRYLLAKMKLGLLASCVASGVTLPLVAAHFHLISPVALLVSPLLAIPVLVGLGAGFATIFLDPLLPSLGQWTGKVCDGCLGLIQWVVDAAAEGRYAFVWTPGPHIWWCWGVYAILGWGLYQRGPRGLARFKTLWLLLAAWLAVGVLVHFYTQKPADALRCTFIDVGHGCSVLMELPGGENWLYDAGQTGVPELGARTIADVLWSRGITRLNGVVISHADVDHFNAVPFLLERFDVDAVYVTPAFQQTSAPAVQVLREAVGQKQVPVHVVAAGNLLPGPSTVVLRVLFPPASCVAGSDNANSLVLAVEYQKRRILLTGDLETPGLEQLLAEPPLACDIALAPHHGSARSNPPGFARWSSARWIIISGTPHAHSAAVARAFEQSGATSLSTAVRGAIEVTVRRDDLEVRTWLDGE